MPRPKTKADLLTASETEFSKLTALLDSMSDSELEAEFAVGPGFDGKEAHWTRDKNVRDVLAHLREWHRLLLTWVAANQATPTPATPIPFLPAPYNWRTYGGLNEELWSKSQAVPLAEARRSLEESHAEVMALIATFDDDALFTKGALAWTGTSTLGSYCVSATSSHYVWASKKIRLHKKLLAKK